MKEKPERPLEPEGDPAPQQPPAPEEYASIPVGQVDEREPVCRTRPDGSSRLSVRATELLAKALKEHPEYEPLHQWWEVKEGRREGSWYLLPTDKGNEDKLLGRWVDAGNEFHISLNKVLKAKGVRVPRGQVMILNCYTANLPGFGAALELRRSEARFADIKVRKSTAGK